MTASDTAPQRPWLRARLGALAPFLGVFGGSLMCFMAIGITLPVLPRYVEGPLGGSDLTVGIVIGAFAFTAVFGRPFMGRVADRRGRKPIYLAGCAIISLAGLLYLVPAGVPGLVGARLVLGLGEACTFGVGAAWSVELVPPERRGQALTLFGLSVWGGLAAGPALGELVLHGGGYDAVWLTAAAFPLLGTAAVARVHDRAVRRPASAGEPLFARAALQPGVALALTIVGYVAMSSFLVLHLDGRDIGGGGFVFTAFAAALFAIRLLGGRVVDVMGPMPVLGACVSAQAIGLTLVAVATSEVVAVLGAVIVGAGTAFVFPSLALLVVRRADPTRLGSALGTFAAFFDLGVALGSPLAGVVAASAGYPATFLVAAGCGLVAWLVARSADRP